MIDKTNGQISIEGNLTLSQHLTVNEFLASPRAMQWTKRWIDSIEVYTRGLLDEKGRKVTVVLAFNADRLKSVGLYYALPSELDFADLFGRGTGEISEFHRKVLLDEFGNSPSPYPWYQFTWGVVRNQMSHIEVRYGVTFVHDPTLKTAYSGSGSDFS
jgi:hypothetical protein